MKTKKTKRTYYGFQMGSPTFPASMDVVTTHKPTCGYQVKCRATDTDEARQILDDKWNQSCFESMSDDDL